MVLAISPKEIKTYTAEGYLALEVASETRNEFRNGKIVPMTGGGGQVRLSQPPANKRQGKEVY